MLLTVAVLCCFSCGGKRGADMEAPGSPPAVSALVVDRTIEGSVLGRPLLNPTGLAIDPLKFDADAHPHELFRAKSPIASKLRLALLLHGVDISGKPGGSVSAAHTQADLRDTTAALRSAIRMLRAEEGLAGT